jgi:hypothetical protein
MLVQVKNKCERSLPVRPPGVQKTSRLGSRDLVASGVKCEPHGGNNGKMKSWTVSWLSLKTKVEPGLRGSRVMSGDWRRLHQVRGVCGGSPENHRVTRLSHKAEAEDRRLGGRRRHLGAPRSFEAEDTRRDRKSCIEAKRGAVAGHPSDGATANIPKVPLGGVYPSIM